MKRIALLALMTLSSTPVFADQYIQGYVRKDGTYVRPHFRSEPNNTDMDNYSTRGNVNPWTGNVGTERPSRGSIGGDLNSYQHMRSLDWNRE